MPLAKIRCHSRNSDTRTLLLVCVEHTTLKCKNSTVALAGHASFVGFFRTVFGAIVVGSNLMATTAPVKNRLSEDTTTVR